MSELTSREFLFLKTLASLSRLVDKEGVGFDQAKGVLWEFANDVYCKIDYSKMISDLIRKQVVHSSPDGESFKMTDYGMNLLQTKLREEDAWINQGPFIKLSPAKREEIDIKQGEHFKGYWEVLGIMKRAKKVLKVQDAYIGTDTIAMLNELDDSLHIDILTTDKGWKHKELSRVAFEKFKEGRKGRTEMRINRAVHSRRLIIDDLEVYQSDESFKDIGLHNAAKITRLENIEEELTNFNKAWSEVA